ncbi:MAG: sulfotransferase [Chloroflexota bacterium]
MIDSTRLLMISAMYENGGNTTHRFLDGHPELFVYPFESQLGTRYVVDHLSSLFPIKYRWPELLTSLSPEAKYHAIIDEEAKVRSKTPHVSKFRHAGFDLSDQERAEAFCRHLGDHADRGSAVMAFFRATFDAWKNYRRTGTESVYVGYSPVVVVDGRKILDDLPNAHILHIVRNPWAAYADTKKRPMPLSLDTYTLCWNLNQYFAELYQRMDPARVHILRAEDVMADPRGTLGALCEQLSLTIPDSLGYTSYNGERLEQVYPWGTIRTPTPEANLATAKELSTAEQAAIRLRCGQYIETFGYADFL